MNDDFFLSRPVGHPLQRGIKMHYPPLAEVASKKPEEEKYLNLFTNDFYGKLIISNAVGLRDKF